MVLSLLALTICPVLTNTVSLCKLTILKSPTEITKVIPYVVKIISKVKCIVNILLLKRNKVFGDTLGRLLYPPSLGVAGTVTGVSYCLIDS